MCIGLEQALGGVTIFWIMGTAVAFRAWRSWCHSPSSAQSLGSIMFSGENVQPFICVNYIESIIIPSLGSAVLTRWRCVQTSSQFHSYINTATDRFELVFPKSWSGYCNILVFDGVPFGHPEEMTSSPPLAHATDSHAPPVAAKSKKEDYGLEDLKNNVITYI